MAGGTYIEREILHNLLRQQRDEAGLRQVDVAKKLGKPQSYISKYETGEKNLDIIEIKEVCEVLGIKLSDFAKKLENKL
ncbi:helix-turn-helix transcriptional regulator [Candidatus Albibeggiatoa sp. nov. BB20]|uniref:helix-turn-helix domain-containing protein n=1 Tax=Candidatus Albibeggiatoa sp. nov. BB20 TaxID=3162723 RepID=UPI0033657E17